MTKDVSGVKVAHKNNKLLILLAGPVVLGLKECVMIISPFRLKSLRIQFVASVCQIPEVLCLVSMRSGGEFSAKMFNAGKKAKMISHKLDMVGVNLLKN